MKKQDAQDCIWDHFQNDSEWTTFELSYPRLDYLATRFEKSRSVLNIGIGSGHMEEKMYQRGINVYALDPSPKTVDNLKQRIPIGDRACVGHSQSIPFESDVFDGVIMTEVLEHLNDDDLNQTLPEVFRVLKPGGLFIGTVPFREDLRSGTVFCPCCKNTFHRFGHIQSFDKQSMRALMESAGFGDISVIVRSFPDWSRKGARFFLRALMRYVLGRLGEPIVSPNIYFRASKGRPGMKKKVEGA